MSSPADDEIDYLLSRGKLGGSQRERILKAAVAASRDGFWARWRGRLTWSACGLALATGAAIVLFAVRAPTPEGALSFQVKGPGDAPVITVSCLGAQLTSCPEGSRLAFALEGGRDKGGVVTAYAVPAARAAAAPAEAPAAGAAQGSAHHFRDLLAPRPELPPRGHRASQLRLANAC